jgi:hypothetical protein
MTKNPLYNALIAIAYVIGVVTLISYGTSLAGENPDDSFLMPVAMISVLVLSVSFMAYTFFYNPVLLLLDNKRKEAVTLFTRTVAIFAVFTVCALMASFTIFH